MKNFHHTENCPIRDILSRLSSKWAMLILITLDANEVMRFNDLQKSIGDISQRMLSGTFSTVLCRSTEYHHTISFFGH